VSKESNDLVIQSGMVTNPGETTKSDVEVGNIGVPFPKIRVIGIDPGLQITGYGVIESGGGRIMVLEAGVIRPEKGDKELGARLVSLAKGLREILADYRPDHAAMEQLYSHYQHPRTAILMGHARGVFVHELHLANCTLVNYLPTNIKKTVTNAGRASKEQMQYSIMRELGLNAIPEPADVADALAVALCHLFHIKRQSSGLEIEIHGKKTRKGTFS
jgi:crossover junction endodeoxyribonuclease RuvC